MKIRECFLLFGEESFVFQFAIQKLNIKIYRNIMFPVVLYGCETWPFTCREGRRVRIFENRALRRLFVLKWEEETGKCRKQHSEEIKDLHCPTNSVRVIKLRTMKWARHVARMADSRDVYRDLLGKPEEKRQLGRPRSRWEDNIKMDLQKVRCG